MLLEQALRAAQLRPVSFSIGLSALQCPEAEASNGVLALAIGETQVGLQVTCGNGIAALRTLEGALETAAGQRQLRADVLAREARITLAQLPPEMRQTISRVRIFGPRDLAQQLADEVELRLEAMDLQVELVTHYLPVEFGGVQVPSSAPVSAAFSLAAGYLTGRVVPLEFLPPRVTAWQQFAARYSSGKLQRAGVAAGAVALVVGGAFLFQQAQIWRLESQWKSMQVDVKRVERMSAKINQFRPWDNAVRGLIILRKLTEAFPEDSSVTAKTVEIRDLTLVTCTGVARDQQALLKTVERLRSTREFDKVNIGQTRGQSPAMQFTLNFVWSAGGQSAN